jgi:hypothetical protein
MIQSDVTQLQGFFKTRKEAELFSKQIAEDCILVQFWDSGLWWAATKNNLQFILDCFKENENGG